MGRAEREKINITSSYYLSCSWGRDTLSSAWTIFTGTQLAEWWLKLKKDSDIEIIFLNAEYLL